VVSFAAGKKRPTTKGRSRKATMSMDLWLWLILILMLSVVIAQNIGLKEKLKKLEGVLHR
jgi:hypothetical protein